MSIKDEQEEVPNGSLPEVDEDELEEIRKGYGEKEKKRKKDSD